MFEDDRRPLYKLCRKLILPRISSEHYLAHLNKAAQLTWQTELSTDVFNTIMALSERHPHYVNHVCDILWSSTTAPTDEEAVQRAWQEVYEEERSDLIKDFLVLSDNQKRILQFIAQEGGQHIYSSHAANSMQMASGSVRGALEQLSERDFIEKQADGFQLIIPIYKKLFSER